MVPLILFTLIFAVALSLAVLIIFLVPSLRDRLRIHRLLTRERRLLTAESQSLSLFLENYHSEDDPEGEALETFFGSLRERIDHHPEAP